MLGQLYRTNQTGRWHPRTGGDQGDHQLHPEAIEQAVTARTKAILINSPNNPTGAVYTADELDAVVRISEACGCYLIADEAYHAFTYDAREHIRAFDRAGRPGRHHHRAQFFETLQHDPAFAWGMWLQTKR